MTKAVVDMTWDEVMELARQQDDTQRAAFEALSGRVDETVARVSALSAQLQRFHAEQLELQDRVAALERKAGT